MRATAGETEFGSRVGVAPFGCPVHNVSLPLGSSVIVSSSTAMSVFIALTVAGTGRLKEPLNSSRGNTATPFVSVLLVTEILRLEMFKTRSTPPTGTVFL